MSQVDVLATRTAFRDELRKDLMLRANDFYRDLSELAPVAEVPTGDEGNGHSDIEHEPAKVAVLTRRAFVDLVNDVFEVPLPPPSEHYAEVSTPAKVIVAAECPKCGIAHPIEVKIWPVLVVDPDGSELQVKAKAKSRTHVCGQLPLPEPAEEEDSPQQVLPLDGILGDPVEADGEVDGPADPDESAEEDLLPGGPDVTKVFIGGDPLPGGPAVECDGSNHVPGCEHFGPVEAKPAPVEAESAMGFRMGYRIGPDTLEDLPF